MAVYHFSRLSVAKYHKLSDLKQQVCRLTVLEACCCCLVVKSHPILCYPMDCRMSGHPVPHHLLEFVQIHVHWISDAIQPSHPLLPSFPAFSLCQHQGLFQRVSSSHQVAKVLELQFQHQFFQWLIGVDFLWDWLVWSPHQQGTLKNLLQHHSSKALLEIQNEGISKLMLALKPVGKNLSLPLSNFWDPWPCLVFLGFLLYHCKLSLDGYMMFSLCVWSSTWHSPLLHKHQSCWIRAHSKDLTLNWLISKDLIFK